MPIRAGLWDRIEQWAERSDARTVLVTVVLAMCGLLGAVALALGLYWLLGPKP